MNNIIRLSERPSHIVLRFKSTDWCAHVVYGWGSDAHESFAFSMSDMAMAYSSAQRCAAKMNIPFIEGDAA